MEQGRTISFARGCKDFMVYLSSFIQANDGKLTEEEFVAALSLSSNYRLHSGLAKFSSGSVHILT